MKIPTILTTGILFFLQFTSIHPSQQSEPNCCISSAIFFKKICCCYRNKQSNNVTNQEIEQELVEQPNKIQQTLLPPPTSAHQRSTSPVSQDNQKAETKPIAQTTTSPLYHSRKNSTPSPPLVSYCEIISIHGSSQNTSKKNSNKTSPKDTLNSGFPSELDFNTEEWTHIDTPKKNSSPETNTNT